jgi:Zeta toxin
LNPDRHRLSEEEHERIFQEDIKPDLFRGTVPSGNPTVVIFGGQPGAGKSAAVDQAVQQLEADGGSVQIIGDDLRMYHPKYSSLMREDDKTAAFYTDKDSGRWVEKSIAYAQSQRVNAVIEGTFRNTEVVANTMASFRAAGYEVDARVLAVNEKVSEQGIHQRYEAQKADRGVGRMTTEKAHRDAYTGLPVTLAWVEEKKLADRVTVMKRGAEIIYTNELKDGEWAKPPEAVAAVVKERDRPLSLGEREQLVDGYVELSRQISRPHRKAAPEEKARLIELLSESVNGLKAQVFRDLPREQAVQRFPDLAGSYAAVEVATKAAAAAQPDAQATVAAHVKNSIADSIEKGRVPQMRIREDQQRYVDGERSSEQDR